MDAFDRESFEVRADLFGRTIEEELVLNLLGTRASEAYTQLQRLADTRAVRVHDLVRSVEAHHWLQARCVPSLPPVPPPPPPATSPPLPAKIFHVEECPVCCTADAAWCALECGHVVCGECHSALCARDGRNAREGGALCRCPQCRQTSRRKWTLVPDGDAARAEHEHPPQHT